MNPFNNLSSSLNKIKEVKDRRETKKEQREIKEQNRIDSYNEFRGFENLTESELDFMDELREEMEAITRYRVEGTSTEIATLELMKIISEQNNMIISLLGQIRNK